MAFTREDKDFLLSNFLTKEDAKRFITREDAKQLATKKDLDRFVTDISDVRNDVKQVRGDLARFATKADMDRMEVRIISTVQNVETNLTSRLNFVEAVGSTKSKTA